MATRSHSAWSAWIEILRKGCIEQLDESHSAWSAWIEIDSTRYSDYNWSRRTPHGVRGLK